MLTFRQKKWDSNIPMVVQVLISAWAFKNISIIMGCIVTMISGQFLMDGNVSDDVWIMLCFGCWATHVVAEWWVAILDPELKKFAKKLE